MAKRHRRFGGGNHFDPNEPIPVWEDVQPDVREKVEARLAKFRPAPEDVELPDDDPRGKLILDYCNIGSGGCAALVHDRLVNLPGLTALSICGCSIGYAGACAIVGNLHNLRALNISRNSIGYVSNDLKIAVLIELMGLNLKQLTALDISNNDLYAANILPIAEHLPRLITLNISNNPIGDRGVMAITDHLLRLTTLDVSFNAIMGAGVIVDLIDRLRFGADSGGKLKQIRVEHNSLRWGNDGPEIPREVLNITDPERLFAELVSLRPAAAGKPATTERIPWLRATLLGREQIGKSHLFQRLLYGEIVEEVSKTQDWQSHVLPIEGVSLGNVRLDTVPLRLFDLGGDPNLHGAHRTFLRDRRNLYIIVCNASGTRRQNLLDYWLRVVRAYGSYTDKAFDESTIWRCAPTLVLLSWRDKGVGEGFKPDQLTEQMLAHEHGVNVLLLRDYWDPKPAGKGMIDGAEYAQRLEELREKLREMVAQMAGELNYAYRKGTLAAAMEFDPFAIEGKLRHTPLSTGPMTLAQVRENFFKHTHNELDRLPPKTGDADPGIDLLRNMGLVICPQRDAEEAERGAGTRARVDGEEDTPIAPNDPKPELRELRDQVFSVEWLRKPTYRIVRSDSFRQKNGVVSTDELLAELKSQFEGSEDAEAMAMKVLRLLKVQRLVFNYDPGNSDTWLIADCLRPTDPEADANLLAIQESFFANADRYVLKCNLLLDSHLPQFIGLSYMSFSLRSDSGYPLRSDTRRDRVHLSSSRFPKVEVLLMVDLNAGELIARVRNGTQEDQCRFLAVIGHQFGAVTAVGVKFEQDPRGATATTARGTEGSALPSTGNAGNSRQELQARAERFVEAFFFPKPQYLLAWILGCAESTLTTIIKGDPPGLQPSTTLKEAQGKAPSAKGPAPNRGKATIDTGIANGLRAKVVDQNQKLMLEEELVRLARKGKGELIEELIKEETNDKKRAECRRRANLYREEDLRLLLATRRVAAE